MRLYGLRREVNSLPLAVSRLGTAAGDNLTRIRQLPWLPAAPAGRGSDSGSRRLSKP